MNENILNTIHIGDADSNPIHAEKKELEQKLKK